MSNIYVSFLNLINKNRNLFSKYIDIYIFLNRYLNRTSYIGLKI